MFQSTIGSFRVLRLAGIDVYVHWAWALVVLLDVQFRGDVYQSRLWLAAELLAVVAIVLLHELGHALACRSVGGMVHRIVLWPLCGAALVSPPPRPEKWLWTVAAGPMVNLILMPLTVGVALLAQVLHWKQLHPDPYHFLTTLAWVNMALLLLNLLPIYPMDGGQILMALLWFQIGRPYSLMAVSILGMFCGGMILMLAVAAGQGVLGFMALFIVFQAMLGFRQARHMAHILGGPRHKHAICPSCGVAALVGDFWRCDACGTSFDTFATHGSCPECGKRFEQTRCFECHQLHPTAAWLPPEDHSQKQPPVVRA